MDMKVDKYVYNNINIIYSTLYIDDHIKNPSTYILRMVYKTDNFNLQKMCMCL